MLPVSANAQTRWDRAAAEFTATIEKHYEGYGPEETQEAIGKAGEMIKSYGDSSSVQVLGSVYFARARLRGNVLMAARLDGGLLPGLTLSGALHDFRKALSLAPSCECDILTEMSAFYGSFMSDAQVDSLQQVLKEVGVPIDHTYLGFGLSYSPQQHVIGGDVCVLGVWTISQPKKWRDAQGKKYRKCEYFYPMAVGLFSLGGEVSLAPDANYRAVKLDPVWIHYIFSAHPFQLLYADGGNSRSFIYRAEAGLSFSTLSVNYQFNLPFMKSFKAVPMNALSIRFYLPTISMEKR